MNDGQVREFAFDLVFALKRKDPHQDAIIDALFEAGCDDAVVGLAAQGLPGLAFTRRGSRGKRRLTAPRQKLRGIAILLRAANATRILPRVP